MTDDDPIRHSPLDQTVTRDGASVQIHIYRGREDPGWILEVVDEGGGSTVWEDFFPTDQEALDEAMSALEAEGIAAFTVVA